jgi:hypothetical protein
MSGAEQFRKALSAAAERPSFSLKPAQIRALDRALSKAQDELGRSLLTTQAKVEDRPSYDLADRTFDAMEKLRRRVRKLR